MYSNASDASRPVLSPFMAIVDRPVIGWQSPLSGIRLKSLIGQELKLFPYP